MPEDPSARTANGSLQPGADRSFREVNNTGSASRPVAGLWHYASTAPAQHAEPATFHQAIRDGLVQPRTMDSARPIASAMHRAGHLDLEHPPDLDGQDWWIWCELADDTVLDGAAILTCEGLASIVDIWWNERWMGRADNMFIPWEAAVHMTRGCANVLTFCCRAMTPLLIPQRPRARWRARLLESQEWRWHRTTHLGRMPGVGPRIPPVGPWRSVTIAPVVPVMAEHVHVVPRRVGNQSILTVSVTGRVDGRIEHAELRCGAEGTALRIDHDGNRFVLHGELRSDQLAAWWPHTHGIPTVYTADIVVRTSRGVYEMSLGDVAFRSLAVALEHDGFGVQINDVPIFLRGTCWAPADWAQLDTLDEQFAADIPRLVDAGLNCVRFSGCFTYPSDRILALCDRFGLTVWHDLMFSVLDYPMDTAFVERCVHEAQTVARRAQSHACVFVICGASEVEQQAAMMGLPTDASAHGLFRETLAAAVQATAPDVLYWPGTPYGGALPMQLTTGTSHYFGVGAYRRSLDDARRAGVRFATECLAFANLADPESPSATCRAADSAAGCWHVHVNRDGGAEWDFADIREHYTKTLFGVDSDRWSARDAAQYSAYGRAAVNIAIERTMQEFRRLGSPTQGALTWLWRDPWRGAGWGMLDHDGHPKSAWYAMRRACRPVALALSDEGLDGVAVHLWNDSTVEITGTLTVRLLSAAGKQITSGQLSLVLRPHSAYAMSCDRILGAFTDSTNAYRFATRGHDVVHAAWTSHDAPRHAIPIAGRFEGAPLIDDAALIVSRELLPPADPDWSCEVGPATDGVLTMALSCRRVAQFVRVIAPGWAFNDAYFTMVPGVTRELRAQCLDPAQENLLRSTLTIEALTAPSRFLAPVAPSAGA